MRTLISLTVILCLFANTFSQNTSRTGMAKNAIEDFNNSNYFSAIPLLEKLNKIYPEDVTYAYYLGASYVKTKKSIDKAVELLKMASEGNNYEDAQIYLGRAYHLNYQFDKASETFDRFSENASRKEIRENDIDYWKRIVNNAKEATQEYIKLEVVKTYDIPENSYELLFRGNDSLNVKKVPLEFRSEQDKSNAHNALMFLPIEGKKGKFMFLERYTKNNTLNLYFVECLSKRKFSFPFPLPSSINSDKDEAFPFYDDKNKILYYASKGHESMGGYDIFKVKFFEKARTWSSPERLPFPINTPYDDFLYVNDKSGHFTYFSDRNANDRMIKAYKIIDKKYEVKKTDKSTSLKNLALLKGELEQKQIETPKRSEAPLPKKNEPDKPNKETVIDQSSEKSEESEKTDTIKTSKKPSSEVVKEAFVKENTEKEKPSEYEEKISHALKLQSKSDSLQWIISSLKSKINAEKDIPKRQILIGQLKMAEKEALETDKLAKSAFESAENMTPEQGNNAEVIEPVYEKEGIEVFAYSDTNKIDSYPDTQKKDDINNMKEFDVLDQSPYSHGNPIPEFKASDIKNLEYKIQLGVFSEKVAFDKFKGLSPIESETLENRGLIKYYVGRFNSISQTKSALKRVREYGFGDAFIVAFYEHEKIPIEKAREVEFSEK